jgi:hypothetical protein
MYGPRLCNEYIKGVDAFIDFIKKDMLDNIRGNLCCTYKHCKNKKRYLIDDRRLQEAIISWLCGAVHETFCDGETFQSKASNG